MGRCCTHTLQLARTSRKPRSLHFQPKRINSAELRCQLGLRPSEEGPRWRSYQGGFVIVTLVDPWIPANVAVTDVVPAWSNVIVPRSPAALFAVAMLPFPVDQSAVDVTS